MFTLRFYDMGLPKGQSKIYELETDNPEMYLCSDVFVIDDVWYEIYKKICSIRTGYENSWSVYLKLKDGQ